MTRSNFKNTVKWILISWMQDYPELEFLQLERELLHTWPSDWNNSHPVLYTFDFYDISVSISLLLPFFLPSKTHPSLNFIAWKVMGPHQLLFSNELPVFTHGFRLMSFFHGLNFILCTEQRSYLKQSKFGSVQCQNILTKWWSHSDICKYGKVHWGPKFKSLYFRAS